MELRFQNLSGKAFRFGIFSLPNLSYPKLQCPCFAMEISRIRMVSLWRARSGAEVMQVLVCEPGLGKVGGGWLARDGSIPVLWYRFLEFRSRPRLRWRARITFRAVRHRYGRIIAII